MEITELKYFLEVALEQHVGRAAKRSNISIGSLSKAVSKLENELGVTLFKKVGRNIQITEEGRVLQKRASEMLNFEERIRLEIGGDNRIKPVICGRNFLLEEYGISLGSQVARKYPNFSMNFEASSDDDSVRKVLNGEAHIALVTSKISPKLNYKKIDEIKFKVCVGSNHPLANLNKKVNINELLKYHFVISQNNFLSKIKSGQSSDGWRDDKFPRDIRYKVSDVNLLIEIVSSGLAVAYIPDYISKKNDFTILETESCPYSCEQKVYMACRKPKELGWLNSIW